MSVARGVVELAVAIPMTALELVLGEGVGSVLSDRRRAAARAAQPSAITPSPEPRFTRTAAR
ncbi:MAG: hypothetical protein ACJ762_07370 [Solirubrobacteraceae bacterium]